MANFDLSSLALKSVCPNNEIFVDDADLPSVMVYIPKFKKKMKARMRYIAKEYEAGLIDFDSVDATMQSYFGMLSHCSTHGLQKWIRYLSSKRKASTPL